MALPERFETPRCVVRRHVPYDAGKIFAAFGQDPDVTRYLGWKPHAAVGDTRRQLSYDTHRWIKGSAYTWVVVLKDGEAPVHDWSPGEIVGLIQLIPNGHRARLGYLLAHPYWNRGLMTEAVAPVVAAALEQPQIYRVDAVCDVDNPASARVLEKLGMEREGRLRRYILHPNVSSEPRDVLIYSAVR
jgi:RimJ/RimL family protein N-acetyltransferase